MTYRGALLDIDGTLLDTNYLHTVAWWRALRDLGHTFPMARIHRLIGMGGDKLVSTLIGRAVEGAESAYGAQFERLRGESVPLPGARRLVRVLHDAGMRIVLASSARSEDLDHFRSVLDVDAYLAGATSSADAANSKPDSEIFEIAIERYDLERSRTFVVGDTRWDALAASEAHLRFVGVETGGWTAAELVDAGAGAVYAGADALADDLGTGPISDLWTSARSA